MWFSYIYTYLHNLLLNKVSTIFSILTHWVIINLISFLNILHVIKNIYFYVKHIKNAFNLNLRDSNFVEIWITLPVNIPSITVALLSAIKILFILLKLNLCMQLFQNEHSFKIIKIFFWVSWTLEKVFHSYYVHIVAFL